MKFYFGNLKSIISLIIFIKIAFICCENPSEADDSIVHILSSTGSIDSFANLPNGYLASASSNGLIQIWNIEEGILVRTLKSLTDSPILKLASLHNGFLVSTIMSDDGTIEIWNPNDGLLKKSIKVSDKHLGMFFGSFR